MSTILLGLLLFAAAVGAMAVGPCLGRGPLRRGCGREDECTTCSEWTDCPERTTCLEWTDCPERADCRERTACPERTIRPERTTCPN